MGVKISGFAGDYVIFADPDQADRWILNGPPGLPEAVEIEPLPDDRYRLQRKALNEILNKACLSFEFVAAAGTQTQIPDELLPKWRQRLGLDGVRPESVSEIDILPGEESKPWEDRQRQALTLALSDRPLCAIKGPPGTGKSAVIVSLVRRLARAGQRVLFVAPQHVAVDEVLHRLHELREQGDETSVTAVRVAPRDESRIDRRLRMYLPDRVSEAVRDEVLARAERALSELGDRDDVTADLERVRAEIPWLEEVCTFEDNLAGTVANIEKAGEERAAIFSEIIRQESVRDREAKALEDSWLPRFLNFGPSGRHAAAVSTLEELRPKARELETRILDLEAAEEKATAAIETGLESCRKRFGEWLPTETTRTRLKALLARREQLGWRLEEAELRLRWRDEAQTQEADIRFRDAVLDSANLIASTTQGIATNPFLRDQSFDVLICDESSRATRGELLVAASRCSRIILVGDEKQLPPYVDRDEELLFQALALRDLRTECQDLDQAVEQLQAGWNEGADLDWRRVYESDVKTCLERLESTGDPPGPRRRLQEWRELYDAASRSCFDHALSQLRGEDCVRLDVQRRMPDSIARIVRNPVYGGDFRSGEHARKAHPGGDWYFYDTSPRAAVRNSKYREKFADRGFWNDGEADDVARLVGREASAWRAAFGGTPSIMVITFYRQHAREILRRLDGRRDVPRGVIVLPIDQCQGREADVVILSFARTHASPRPNWGLWLQEPRRLNVALTRARQRLIIVGSLATIAKMRGNIEGQAILSSLANEVSLQRTRVFDV